MNNRFNIKNYKHVHFIGIGGVSMSSLAEYTIRQGKQVTGSDKNHSDTTSRLSLLGAKIFFCHAEQNVAGADLVVYSSAISKDNVELLYAVYKGICVIKRSQYLGEILREYSNVIAVSGCHGKTTTTAMLASVFCEAGLDPTVFLGGESIEFGNFRLGSKNYAIVEACEYQKNFLDLYHTTSVVLNVDKDHMECYLDFNHLVDCYLQFCLDTIKVVGVDNLPNPALSQSAITFGVNERARFSAKNIILDNGKPTFDLYDYNQFCCKIKLNVYGKHNVYNALAVASVCAYYGIGDSKLKRGLENFKSVKRRMEHIAIKDNVSYICDYAHHPEEIAQTIKTLSDIQDTLFVFQPHTYSRTKSLMKEFVEVLKEVAGLIIYKTYPAREKYSYKSSAKYLYERVKERSSSVKYCVGIDSLKKEIEESLKAKNYKSVCFVGAGDIYEIAKTLFKTKNVKSQL